METKSRASPMAQNPQTKKEKNPKNNRKNPASQERKKISHKHTPRSLSNLPQLKPKTPQSGPSDTLPLLGHQPQDVCLCVLKPLVPVSMSDFLFTFVADPIKKATILNPFGLGHEGSSNLSPRELTLCH